MWTFDNFPADAVKAKYGVSIDQAWLDWALRRDGEAVGRVLVLDRLRRMGLSSPIIIASPTAPRISPPRRPITTPRTASMAAILGTERQGCPGGAGRRPHFHHRCHATAEGGDRGRGGPERRWSRRGHAAEAAIEGRGRLRRRAGRPLRGGRLYHGGIYNLYRYRRYQDVRLVFAPEMAIGVLRRRSGQFRIPALRPRRDLSAVYDGRPADTPQHLRWNPRPRARPTRLHRGRSRSAPAGARDRR